MLSFSTLKWCHTCCLLPSLKALQGKKLLAQLEKKKGEESFSFMHLSGNTPDQELSEHREHNSGYSAPRWELGLSWLVEHTSVADFVLHSGFLSQNSLPKDTRRFLATGNHSSASEPAPVHLFHRDVNLSFQKVGNYVLDVL